VAPERFFPLVAELLTGPMADLDFHHIGDYAGESSDAPLVRGSRWRRRPRPEPMRSLTVGYEAGSDEARARVNPHDPESADELWLSHRPVDADWDDVAVGRVGWDVRLDRGPCTDEEVHRRLTELGLAVRRFAVER
jgi:hypothetical protein